MRFGNIYASWMLIFTWGAIGFGQPAPQTNPLPGPAKAAAPEKGSTPELDKLKQDAEAAYQQADYAKGIEITNKVLAQNPTDHVALYLRGSCRVELGQARSDVKEIRSGIEDARDALRAGGSTQYNYYLPYLYGMTGLAWIENRPEHAEISIKIAADVLARNPKPEEKSNIYYQRAGAYIYLKNYDAAIADYLEAIKLTSTHLGAHVGLAEAYLAARKPELAMKAYNDTVQAFPQNPLVYNNRGIFFQQQNRYPEAIADFTKTLQLDPTYFVGLTNRGFVLLHDGQPAQAEADFNASLKINAQQPLVYNLRGTARLSQGRIPEALQDYQQVLQLTQNNAVGTADIGFAKFFAKEYPGALQSFDQAISMDASMRYLDPWRYWALVLSGKRDGLAKQFADHFDKPADKRDWVDSLVLFLDGKISEQELVASAEKADATMKTPQLCEAYYFMGERRALLGDQPGAKAFFRQALNTKARHLSAYRGAQFSLQEFPGTAKP